MPPHAPELSEADRLSGLTGQLADLGTWHRDPDTTFLAVSAQAGAILGVAPARRASISTVLERIAPQDRFGLLRGMMRAFKARAGTMCRIRLTTPTGAERTLIVNARREAFECGKPGLRGIVQDISIQAEVERKLTEARDSASAAARAKTEFLAAMSHEIRTPMTGILGMIELFAEVEGEEERGQYLSAMRQSAQTLMAVLDGVLDFSKIDAGQITLRCGEFDLPALVRQTVLVFQSAASQKGVSLDVTIDPGVSPIAVGDSFRLQQVLGNFISNAAKSTDSGRIAVSVRARPGSKGNQRWTFAVSDTGDGMASATAETLSDPLLPTGDGNPDGIKGLGLAISRRIIGVMGGQVTIRSKKDRGSTFSFTLDLPVAEQGTAAGTDMAASMFTGPTRTLSILIAEDNAISQMLVATLMHRKGHRATCVDNGRRAAEAAIAMPFDCILMDMQMPEVDGIQATRTIRESGGRNALIPIIALTADAMPERRRFYENVGLSGFLTKPIDRKALFRAIDAIAAAPPVRESRSAPSSAIDFKQLDELETVLGKKKLHTLLDMACTELTTRPAAMRGLVKGDDLAVLRKEAHSFKGAVASVGLVAAACAAKAVELALPGAELEHSLDRLESEASRALRAVRSILAEDPRGIAAAGG
ncbi:MAG: response regulator [Sphingomicrobium sp.]